jgi:hypothetical protein
LAVPVRLVTPDDGSALHVGVGHDDHRVLAAQFKAVRDQVLGSAHCDLAAGAG